MPREITLKETATVKHLAAQSAELAAAALTGQPMERLQEGYEQLLGDLIALAFPVSVQSERILPDGFRCTISRDGAVFVSGPMASAMVGYINSEPPTATLSPGASGAAAAGVASSPPAGGGHLSPCVTAGLLTYEGLLDALTAYQADVFGGHVQPDAEGWARQTFDFIIRHAERQSDEAALAHGSHIADFVAHECTLGGEVQVLSGVLYSAYSKWCGQKGITPAREVIFAREISSLGLKKKHSNGAWWVGIALAQSEEVEAA